MKITKQGTLPSNTLYGRCNNCSCEVEVPNSEAWFNTDDHQITTLYCPCPTEDCQYRIVLQPETI